MRFRAATVRVAEFCAGILILMAVRDQLTANWNSNLLPLEWPVTSRAVNAKCGRGPADECFVALALGELLFRRFIQETLRIE